VRYYDNFDENNYKYFVMEYCKKGNLKQLINNKKTEKSKFTETV
jgi:serine/threonine protein kinase